jgi:hypothetical protein
MRRMIVCWGARGLVVSAALLVAFTYPTTSPEGGLQVGKVRKLGPLPMKFDVQFQYFPVRPQVGGPRWNLQLQVTPLLPGLIKRKLF